MISLPGHFSAVSPGQRPFQRCGQLAGHGDDGLRDRQRVLPGIRRRHFEASGVAENARRTPLRGGRAKAVDAAKAQHTVLITQATGARLVARLAEQIMTIDADIAELDVEITQHFQRRPDEPSLLSRHGFGVVSAAIFLANTGETCTRSRPSIGSPASPACEAARALQDHIA